MKGIVLAGGTGSRLHPLTKATNKHLLPVADKPMIFHPVEKLMSAGITDIAIVTGTEHMGAVVQCLGSGKAFGCSFTYKVQDEAGGIAQALGLCKDFCYGSKFCVVLGDNIFEDDLYRFVKRYSSQKRGALILLADACDKTRYGVAFCDPVTKKIVSIVEKPSGHLLEEENNIGHMSSVITGVYFYDYTVFDVIATLAPSDRGELEISDVNNTYLDWGNLEYDDLVGYWTDAGTLESYKVANSLVWKSNGNLLSKKD